MKSLFFVIGAIAVGFLSVMLINDSKPSAAWEKIEGWSLDHLHLKKPTPTPTPEPTPTPTLEPTPTPTTDPTPTTTLESSTTNPIAWFIEHFKGKNQEVRIKQPIDFPATYEGKIVGTIKKPTGTSVKIIAINATNVTISFNGNSVITPIESTDLFEVAKFEMEHANQSDHATNQETNSQNIPATLTTTAKPVIEPTFNVSSFLEKPVLDSKEVLDCFVKNTPDSLNNLTSKIVKMNGVIQKIQIFGMDSDKVELTLSSIRSKRLVLKLMLQDIINKSKIEGDVKNKLVLENGHLKLISDLISNGSSYYYYYWNGNQYVRNYYNGTYYGPYGYRNYGKSKELESSICHEGGEITNWSCRLSSNNETSIYFDVVEL